MTEHFAHVVRGSGPGLLLAHGAGGGIEANYGPILDDLARTHTVVGPDYPGSGATPRSDRPLDLDSLADSLVATAVSAGVDRFTILGYSLGTAVAVRAATRHPERVTGLVLTAGFAHPTNQMRLAVDVWRALLDQENQELLAKYLTFAATGGRFLNSLSPADLDAAVGGLVVPPGTPDQVDLVAAVDTRAELARIAVPALVIGTRQDVLVPAEVQRALADGIPGAEYVEIESGHLMQIEARDDWLAHIQKFLSRI
ncbi:alpha/beta fold hydrolase [Amycolatopsis thermophila]|uniref:Pimeloyl-ACP methyl ester carboxylesterase n=1 Tax=Amycolatopsis thermophila TaxID=206084 RepID=A0ABU0ENV5_9PSEU|nr:alpha/beta hydrolase [Amycolatopsis thermophila]MDQ0376977.1 pimeloyl-ACP methyl ester carboxylesterase [Amycolatopsis thermophila]